MYTPLLMINLLQNSIDYARKWSLLWYCILCPFLLSAQVQIKLKEPSLFNNAFIVNEAGSNYATYYETREGILSASVKLMPATSHNKTHQQWTLSIHSNELDWHPDLRLCIRLNAHGNSEFTGVLNSLYQYQEIHSFPSVLAKGSGWISNIPIQLSVEGVSVTLPVKNYITEIFFTITEP